MTRLVSVLKSRPAKNAGSARLVQRKCACGNSKQQCEECRERRGGVLQRSAKSASRSDVPTIVHDVLRSPGRPLDEQTREHFEFRMGHDFSDVRVHTDGRAGDAAASVAALAYTAGSHIVFGKGQFAPTTPHGRRLLAHELTHTVQQGPYLAVPTALGPVDGLHESEATDNENRVETGLGTPRIWTPGLHSPLGVIQRQMMTPLGAGGGFSGLMERDRRRMLARPSSETQPQGAVATDEESAEAGLIALVNVLREAAHDTGLYRDLYNQGLARIESEIARMRAAGMTEQVIAERGASLRHALAEDVRRVSGALLEKAAQLYDLIRGNVGRPTYESLRALGKSDAEIIASATRSNRFVNRLPSGLRWTGRALWVLSAAISVYVIVTAPEGQRLRVAEQEAGGLAGGATGAAVAEGVCIAVGIATEGLGLLACGLLGGLLGFEGGRRLPGLLEKSATLQLDCLKTCDALPWYSKGFCQLGCSGGVSP